MPFELSDEFTLLSERSVTRDYSRASCKKVDTQLVAGLLAWQAERNLVSARIFGIFGTQLDILIGPTYPLDKLLRFDRHSTTWRAARSSNAGQAGPAPPDESNQH